MGQELRRSVAGSSAQLSHGCTRGVSWAVFSYEGSAGEESAIKFIQGFGRIHFFVILLLRAPASCWLLAGGCSPVLEVTLPHGLLHHGFWLHPAHKESLQLCVTLAIVCGLDQAMIPVHIPRRRLHKVWPPGGESLGVFLAFVHYLCMSRQCFGVGEKSSSGRYILLNCLLKDYVWL